MTGCCWEIPPGFSVFHAGWVASRFGLRMATQSSKHLLLPECRHIANCGLLRRDLPRTTEFHRICLRKRKMKLPKTEMTEPTIVSPAVLPIRTLCLSSFFGARFLSSSQHSRWGAAPNARCCGGQELPVISVGASDRPEQLEPVVHTRFIGKAQAAPAKLRKATAPPYAAAIHLLARNSTLLRAARAPLQLWLGYSALRKACSHPIAAPIW